MIEEHKWRMCGKSWLAKWNSVISNFIIRVFSTANVLRLIASAKEVMFSAQFVGLRICLSAGLQKLLAQFSWNSV